MFSVLELHQNSIIEGSHKKHSNKFDHLVLGPAAGQGLRDRLQCQGLCNMLLYVTNLDAFKLEFC